MPAQLLLPLATSLMFLLLGGPATSPTTQPTVVRSTDGSVEVTLPAGWEMMTDDAHRAEPWVINVANPQQGIWCAIRALAKEDLVDMTLEKLEQQSRDTYSRLDDLKIGDAQKMEINGNPAIQREVSGATGGERWAYQCTIIETPSQFLCIYGCAKPSRFATAKPQFDALVQGTRGLIGDPAGKK